MSPALLQTTNLRPCKMERLALFLSAVVAALLLLTPCQGIIPVSFDHGVASGDPLPNRVILWTRVTIRSALPPVKTVQVDVSWEVSLTGDMKQVVSSGATTTNGNLDWTVKVDAGGLQPGTTYYYQFASEGMLSVVGRTKTAPRRNEDIERLRYAIFGCSAWGYAYFNAYEFASRYTDLDFVIHLGDMFYEYNQGMLDPTVYGRQGYRHIPYTEPLPSSTRVTGHFDNPRMSGEILTFDEYAMRYKSYRSDPGLQALAANTPWIAIWDDHETADNSWVNGSRNHNDVPTIDEGSWEDRKTAAVRAWHLYMPIRTKALKSKIHIYRHLQFGKLASLILLEDRLTARTNSNPQPGDPIEMFSDDFASVFRRILKIIGNTPISDWEKPGPDSVGDKLRALKVELDEFRRRPEGKIIGDEQLSFLESKIDEAVRRNTRWVLLGQQQVMGDLYLIDYEGALSRAPTSYKRAVWSEVITNLTSGVANATTCSYATYPAANRREYLNCFPVTEQVRTSARAALAAGKYRINAGFDDWHGYTDERARVLKVLAKMRGNVIVHGSDVHSEFASILRTDDSSQMLVGAEFTITTTSSGLESLLTFAPMDLNDAAIVAGNAASMRYASTNGRGTAIITLTKEKAHVDYYFMDEPSKLNYQAMCNAAFDYFHSSLLSDLGVPRNENDMVRTQCLPGPKSMPYTWMIQNTGVHFQNPLLVDVPF